MEGTVLPAEAGGAVWVITSYRDRALVVRQPGDGASWDRLYFVRIQRFSHYPLRRDRPVPLDRRPITVHRLLLVASSCSAIERGAFAGWAGLQQSRLLWSSPKVGDAAAIGVEEWRLGAAAPLDLWIVR